MFLLALGVEDSPDVGEDERFNKKTQDNGSAAGTSHQVHRTVRAAQNEAKRRRHLAENPATIAKAPHLEEEEVVPYTVEEVQFLVEVANRQRTIIAEMQCRPALQVTDASGKVWTNADLAKELKTALDSGNLDYAMEKAKDGGAQYGGAVLEFFRI